MAAGAEPGLCTHPFAEGRYLLWGILPNAFPSQLQKEVQAGGWARERVIGRLPEASAGGARASELGLETSLTRPPGCPPVKSQTLPQVYV